MFGKILIIASALVIATTFEYTNIAKAQIVREGLVSYWTFDESDMDGETAKDVWGDNHGTIVGDPKVVEGKIGDALEFDGAVDYIRVPHSESLKPKEVTVSAWIFPKVAGGNNIIASSGDHHPIRGYELHIGSAGRGNMTVGDGTNWNEVGFLEGSITNNEWHYLTGMYNVTESKGTIYRNGEQTANGWKAMGLVYSPNDSGIGGPGGKFNGIIDEVCVYNRILNEDEVKQNFAAKDNSLAIASSTKSLALTWGRIKVSR